LVKNNTSLTGGCRSINLRGMSKKKVTPANTGVSINNNSLKIPVRLRRIKDTRRNDWSWGFFRHYPKASKNSEVFRL